MALIIMMWFLVNKFLKFKFDFCNFLPKTADVITNLSHKTFFVKCLESSYDCLALAPVPAL